MVVSTSSKLLTRLDTATCVVFYFFIWPSPILKRVTCSSPISGGTAISLIHTSPVLTGCIRHNGAEEVVLDAVDHVHLIKVRNNVVEICDQLLGTTALSNGGGYDIKMPIDINLSWWGG